MKLAMLYSVPVVSRKSTHLHRMTASANPLSISSIRLCMPSVRTRSTNLGDGAAHVKFHERIMIEQTHCMQVLYRRVPRGLEVGRGAYRKVASAIQSSPLVKPLKEMTAPVAFSVGASTTFLKYCSRASPPAAPRVHNKHQDVDRGCFSIISSTANHFVPCLHRCSQAFENA